MDFGAARPRQEGLGLSPIRDTARTYTGSVPPGCPSRSALTALEVVDLMEKHYWARNREKRLYARLPRLEETPKTSAEVELFLTAIEETAERAGLPDRHNKLAINQMSIILATNYRQLAVINFPGLPLTYERLVEAMVENVAPATPEGHLLKEIKTLEAGKMEAQLDRMYQTYLALCRRTRKVPLITKQIVVGIYLRYLPEELGVQVRDLTLEADLEPLHTAAKFAAAREDRRTTRPLLRDMRGLPLSRGDAAGLLLISGETDGSIDPKFAARELRAPAAHIADRAVHRHGGGSSGDGTGPPASDRRREGVPNRPARPMAMSPHVPAPTICFEGALWL